MCRLSFESFSSDNSGATKSSYFYNGSGHGYIKSHSLYISLLNGGSPSFYKPTKTGPGAAHHANLSSFVQVTFISRSAFHSIHRGVRTYYREKPVVKIPCATKK